MFVCHHLITVDRMFRLKLDGEEFEENGAVAMGGAVGGTKQVVGEEVIPVIPQIRRQGNDLLTDHVERKKEQLTDHLIMAEGEFC